MAIGDEIAAMKRACEQQVPEKRIDCPRCAWNLEETEYGMLHCEFCGWTDSLARIGTKR